MKRYFTLGYATVTALCFIVLMFACQKESSLIPTATSSQISENYLEFKDKDEFDKTVKDLAKKSRQELDDWDKTKNFVSLRGLFDRIVDEENTTADKEDALIKENPKLKSTMKHQYSSLLNECKQMISADNSGMDMKIFELEYAKVLNKDGIVKIGSSLYQFGADNYKIVTNADYSNVKKLSTLTNDNQTDNLKYYPVRVSSQLIKNGRTNNEGYCWSNDGGQQGTNYGLEAWATGYYYYLLDTSTWTFNNTVEAGVRMKFCKNHWYGWTNYASSGYYVSGTYSFTISGLPVTPTSAGPTSYTTPQGFSGESSQPSYSFIYRTWKGSAYPYGSSVTLGGTHNFVFFIGNCECPINF